MCRSRTLSPIPKLETVDVYANYPKRFTPSTIEGRMISSKVDATIDQIGTMTSMEIDRGSQNKLVGEPGPVCMNKVPVGGTIHFHRHFAFMPAMTFFDMYLHVEDNITIQS